MWDWYSIESPCFTVNTSPICCVRHRLHSKWFSRFAFNVLDGCQILETKYEVPLNYGRVVLEHTSSR